MGAILQDTFTAATAKTSWIVLTTEWLPWLQTSLRDSGYERFALILETNCIMPPKRQLNSSFNHNTVNLIIMVTYGTHDKPLAVIQR